MRTGAIVFLSLIGCTASPDSGTDVGTGDGSDVATTIAASTNLATAGCVTTSPGVWQDDFIPQQNGHFQVTYALRTDTNPIDAVVGLGNVKATHFTDLAAIARLNPQGQIDARDGSSYRADAPFTYGNGFCWLKMDVDIPTHRYSVTAWHDGTPDVTTIASNYAFRTEQQSITRIANVSQFIDSGSGQTELCDAYTSPQNCSRTFNQKQWYVTPFLPRAGQLTFDVNVETIGYNIDAVVGLSPSSTPHAFTDLAAIARFNADGYIDARDGSTYHAENQVSYGIGETFHLRFVVDTTTHRYSLYVRGYYDTPIATNYAFRTEQANATTLQTMALYVDNTNTDFQLIACDLAEVY